MLLLLLLLLLAGDRGDGEPVARVGHELVLPEVDVVGGVVVVGVAVVVVGAGGGGGQAQGALLLLLAVRVGPEDVSSSNE